jgi:thioredoxin-related protein
MLKSIFFISVLATLSISFSSVKTSVSTLNSPEILDEDHPGPIDWITIEEAVELHKKEPKYWVIDLYTDWCGWCKRMDATTFQDPLIAAEIEKNFYAVKFNGEAKRDIIIEGQTFKFIENGRRGYHELAAQLMGGNMSYPSFSFMSNEKKLIQTIPGFKTKEEFLPILKYLGEEAYLTTSWENYMAKYTSPYPSQEN